jgi:hypothetical protein
MIPLDDDDFDPDHVDCPYCDRGSCLRGSRCGGADDEPLRVPSPEELARWRAEDPWAAPPNPDWTDEPPFEVAS